ncbi:MULTISPECIES: hypothetical protein [unclassified Sphingomonas]|uniref:hypothetical protein n=1 Tax=Sphingomonas TaxID=13687 RepID=UPI00095BBD10|nr:MULTISPECIES: hypothetical protein [unclassified Sphingomonas]MBN8812004.1 hypothetical protein [Sphingomonas sp.]OJY48348.1 MAG: hypothetical protein BGP17_00770 [Sphingomonas sp. 67-41]
MPARIRYSLVAAICGLWVASLFLPVFDAGGPGWILLAMGWLGIGIGELSWLANPLLLVLVVLLLPAHIRGSKRFLACAVFLGFVLLREAMRSTIMVNEAGTLEPVQRFAGCYAWMGAVSLGMIAAAVQWGFASRPAPACG